MKKLILAIFLLIAMPLISACGNTKSSADNSNNGNTEANSNQKYVLKLAHSYSPGSYMHTFMEWFNEEVQKSSEGRLSLEIYPSAQLMPHDQEVPALLQGQIDMVHSTSPVLSSFDPIWNFFDLPFIFKDNPKDPLVYLENREKFLSSEDGGGMIAKRMEKRGVKILSFSYVDYFGTLFTNGKQVTNVDSAKGLKLRSPGGIITPQTIKAFGASGITITGAEAITAVQQGVVDGMISNPIYAYDVKLPLKNVTFAQLTNTVTPVLMSVDKFESLPKDLQDILVETGKKLETHAKETISNKILEDLNKMESEMGMKIYYPSEKEINEMKTATRSSWKLFEEKVDGGEELLKGISTLD
ncbi:TRAP transporter substrate-binding protein [Neobacillus vireti]|uniref:TRAP transporter substrate-binding protein n=1 Tax=Neobacillus vireti TaxID=220686 RepID=UPI002FFE45A5